MFAVLFGPTVVEAQQPAKVPRIGYVSATGSANNPGHQSRRSGKDCEISVI
jgi:hypothetical protein